MEGEIVEGAMGLSSFCVEVDSAECCKAVHVATLRKSRVEVQFGSIGTGIPLGELILIALCFALEGYSQSSSLSEEEAEEGNKRRTLNHFFTPSLVTGRISGD